jgi:tRNA dimethylallyltransferase
LTDFPHPVPVLTGPTGVGKTALSLALARDLGAEIVSVDSRQIYRGMDIGTAKPSADELAAAPHHFIDEREPDDPISAGEYAELSWQRMADIAARGRMPLLVGGSTLYLKAITEGIARIPETDMAIRAELTERLDREGPEVLFRELTAIDPLAAETMDATKTQRVIRALEVYHSTGTPLSHFFRQHIDPPYRFRVLVLNRDRSDLYARINARVDQMITEGLVSEAEQLLRRFGANAAPLKTIGYREIIDYLGGEYGFERAVELIKQNTRRYAKRQLTWFRSGHDYRWMDAVDARSRALEFLTG